MSKAKVLKPEVEPVLEPEAPVEVVPKVNVKDTAGGKVQTEFVLETVATKGKFVLKCKGDACYIETNMGQLVAPNLDRISGPSMLAGMTRGIV